MSMRLLHGQDRTRPSQGGGTGMSVRLTRLRNGRRSAPSLPYLRRVLLARVGLGNDQTNRMLIESFEAAFALQILQMTHDRPSPTKCFCTMGFGVEMDDLYIV